jgi:5-epi-alpha-selinene synthase
MRRFVRIFRGHLEATLWEAANRARGLVPDLESYLRMRPLTGGLSIITELMEIIEGRHLPQEVREHPTVSRTTEASHNIVCWANDVLSLEKEIEHNEVNNLILVLHHNRGLDLQQATYQAVEMHDAEVRDLVEQTERFPSFGEPLDSNLERYVTSLQHRVRGVLDWSYESGRYRARSEVVATA